jgi:hypothetical protein
LPRHARTALLRGEEIPVRADTDIAERGGDTADEPAA